jgi:hypothetical protein
MQFILAAIHFLLGIYNIIYYIINTMGGINSGRHKITTERLAVKRAELISLFENHTTLEDISSSLNISRQAVQQKLKYYDLLDAWKEHAYKKRELLSFKVPKESGIYCLFFIQEPNKKYYGSTTNLYERSAVHNSLLRDKKHNNIRLQDMFNKYGWESLRFSIVKIIGIEYLLIEEKKLIQNDPDCININLPFQTEEEYKIQLYSANKERYKICRNKLSIKSKYYGVTYDKLTDRWRTQPYDKKLRKQIYLGYFNTEEEANDAIKKYFEKT